MIIVVVNFILKKMIRINRLVKKSSIVDIVHLPHVSKIEILRGKANQTNPSVVRIQIYLRASHADKAHFYKLMKKLLAIDNIDDNIASLIKTSIRDGFIKESTFNKFEIKDSLYTNLCKTYNQEFFNNM